MINIGNDITGKIQQSGRKALKVASGGIAVSLLNDGKTAHSSFKLPLTVSLEQMSVVVKNCRLEKLLKETSLMIWDACTVVIELM